MGGWEERGEFILKRKELGNFVNFYVLDHIRWIFLKALYAMGTNNMFLHVALFHATL